MSSPTTRTTHTNLPADVNSFIGRRQELADARRLLSSSRLVTLTGPGGVGKTRLAARIARDLARSYADGEMWWVELADTRGHEAVAHAVADVIGLRTRPDVPLADSLARHLAEHRALLVLDNCEHLVESCSALVHDLLRRCPHLQVLATSREPLAIDGEFILPVPPLPFPGGHHSETSPESLLGFDSVSLFVERATAGSHGFRLTEDNAASVARICAEIDGIPLAIELAAVRVRALPLDSILRRLKDHSSLAEAATRSGPHHHRTLRASVQWSYELCSEPERTIWARLSVFAGGFDLDAAAAICSGPDMSIGLTTDAIASLVDKSILLREEVGGGVRYRMLEILREFGHECLARADELAELHRRHRDWFLALAEHSYSCWLGAEQPAIVARLRDEYRNLLAAFTHCQGSPRDADSALIMASALEHYWLIRGWQTEGRHWLDTALKLGPEPTIHRARALRVNAYLTALQGDEGVAAMIEEAAAIAERHGDRVEAAWVLMVDGLWKLCQARLDEARVDLDQALADFRREQDIPGEAYTLVMLTALAAALGDAVLAERCHRRCAEITEPRDEVHLRSFSLWGCGLATLRAGDTARALELERDALRLKHLLGDQLGTALAVEVIAWIEVAEGRGERAATMLGATERLWSAMRMTVSSILDFGRFRVEYEQRLATELNARRFEAAFRRGTRMSLEQALPYALGETVAPPRGPLTSRELEIAGQVAQGFTNKRIAVDLRLSQRTVEGHIEKIMTKLGFNNRAQIAAWTTENRD